VVIIFLLRGFVVLLLVFFCVFFFSSRRRHTRSKRDWSSDVCSSDLCLLLAEEGENIGPIEMVQRAVGIVQQYPLGELLHSVAFRSEERRVGKECRSRWAPDGLKEKMEEREREGLSIG